jgi:hypothetical protein
MAVTTYDSAREYYQKLILDISPQDLTNWEQEILHTERTRLTDRAVMDVLGSQHPTMTDTFVPSVSEASGPVAEWMRMVLEIEEKQYAIH